jgi:hypothetical protein
MRSVFVRLRTSWNLARLFPFEAIRRKVLV